VSPPSRVRFGGLFLSLGSAALSAADPTPLPATETTVAQLLDAIRAKAKILQNNAEMKAAFQAFTSKFRLQAATVSLSDYVVARLMFEATRDAGLWNLHWAITDRPPNSDNIWRQWKTVRSVSLLTPTAVAECDELSALYAFLAERAGVKGVGLLWPYPNHTVAVWELRQSAHPVRVVIPTTQIFLDEFDYWGTKKFDPWRQKEIYEYTRRDVPDSFELPKPLFEFFLQQVDKYAGASDAVLQLLRYYRESVFLRGWTPEEAARQAVRVRKGRYGNAREPCGIAEFRGRHAFGDSAPLTQLHPKRLF
jgi:hypothetical protein